VNLKPFFVDALTSALDLGVGKPEDILKYVTPAVLSVHLPRPLWSRLITACLGAPRVDATLVVETIGIPNLCEHMPATIIWACIADIAHRSLGRVPEEVVPVVTKSPAAAAPTAPMASTPSGRVPLAPPPPEAAPQPVRASSSSPVHAGPAIPSPASSPLSDLITELEADDRPPVSAAAAARARTPTSQRFRSSATGINRPIGSATARRPQVQASTPPTPARPSARRGATEVSDVVEPQTETAGENGEWRGREVPVDDSQLVDWQADGGTSADDDFGDLGRKR
jgi:hypothetical protein